MWAVITIDQLRASQITRTGHLRRTPALAAGLPVGEAQRGAIRLADAAVPALDGRQGAAELA